MQGCSEWGPAVTCSCSCASSAGRAVGGVVVLGEGAREKPAVTSPASKVTGRPGVLGCSVPGCTGPGRRLSLASADNPSSLSPRHGGQKGALTLGRNEREVGVLLVLLVVVLRLGVRGWLLGSGKGRELWLGVGCLWLGVRRLRLRVGRLWLGMGLWAVRFGDGRLWFHGPDFRCRFWL